MITYEFPKDGPQNFYSAEGYVEMQVIDGRLVLDQEPGETLLNLIKKFEGERIVKDKEAKSKTVTKLSSKAEKEESN